MSWYQNILPESIKKNVCAYLLQRYLGQFFEEKLTRDQLNIDLYNGTGTVENISLDVQALNELGEQQNWPLEFVDGYIESLFISVPFMSILKDSSYVEVKGLKITVQPKKRNESATSMFESMWNSMTSSMQLAEECARQDGVNSSNPIESYEGIKLFAQTIDSILSRVKVKFVDTVLQIEHVPKNSTTGVGVLMNIDLIEYSDEAGSDPSTDEATNTTQDQKKAYMENTFTTKIFSITGVTLSTVEFSSKARTFSKSLFVQSQFETENDSLVTVIESSNRAKDSLMDTEKVNVKDVFKKVEQCVDDHRHVIKFAKITDKQQVKVRLKQSEDTEGPKVSIDVLFGSFIIFLSPRQFHVLIEVIDGLSKPDTVDTSNVVPRRKCEAKPMTSWDYKRVEQELQHQLQTLSDEQIAGLKAAQGWSSGALDESTEDTFLPMKSNVSGIFESTMSGLGSSMESSVNSSIISSVTDQTTRTRRRYNNIDSDPTAEISSFRIRIDAVATVLLLEDILFQPVENDIILAPSSVERMQQIVDDFFGKLQEFSFTNFEIEEFDRGRELLDKACCSNNIKLFAAPFQIDGAEKTTSSAFSISGELSFMKVELYECLYNTSNNSAEYIQLISFKERVLPKSSNSGSIPNLKMSFKRVEKLKNGTRRGGPKSDITLSLEKLDLELDITLIDRINALINSPNICAPDISMCNPWKTPEKLHDDMQLFPNTLQSKIDWKILCPFINAKLRFPVPDFRPSYDINRIPWWNRSVRNDYLSLIFADVVIQSSVATDHNFQEFTLQSKSLDILYYENENVIPLPVGKAEFINKDGYSMEDVRSQIRLTLKLFPKNEQDNVEPKQNIMTASCYGAFENHIKEVPGPFCAKKVVHQSDTPHSKHPNDDNDEIILPGDKHELEQFIESTIESAKFHIDVYIPQISAQLKSKHIYELLYNRINNDLLLWTPSAPKVKSQPTNLTYSCYGEKEIIVDGQDTFRLCKGVLEYESESDSEESEENIFFSIYDNKLRQSMKQLQVQEPIIKSQSDFVLSIQIGRGILEMHPPVRDSGNNVIPGQQGEFLLSLEDANVFVVSGYKGDDTLGFVCVQLQNAKLYHCDMMSIPSQMQPLKEYGAPVGKHLCPTIYKSERGMLVTSKNRGGQREMFTVSVRIQAGHETHHLKTIRVALGLNKSTLKHRMCAEPNTWISQLLDFFNVQDYPIANYHAKEVVTELHLNVWDCAIDYRPLNLATRAAFTIGNFSMSSHFAAQSNSSTLRFIFEECELFLSEKAPSKNGKISVAPVDLVRDYVNVIELGLFELSLKTTDKKDRAHPHIDLRVSNNILKINTCADSGRMLMLLIIYFANDGDLVQPSSTNSAPPFSSPRHRVETELVSVEPQISNLSKSQHEHVNSLLGEAMKEKDVPKEDKISAFGIDPEVFYFPGEKHMAQQDTISQLPPQVKYELGDVTYNSNRSSDTDDEFCFIGKDSGLGHCPQIPDVLWQDNDPLRVVEYHYVTPDGKTDHLKAPKSFPVPIAQYTLCDMTIVWNIYGGNDFHKSEGENKKVNVQFSETRLNDSVSFSRTKQDEVLIKSKVHKKKANMNWILKGGVNRNHDVHMEFHLNKIRFQHEVYPETTVQASRQVLLISDVEIVDRLESSQFNKFLYQYTSQSRPKQSQAHMVMIKALHIRPDPKLPTQECCLKISMLPLRLNIDQDSLLFLIHFFSDLGNDSSAKSDDQGNRSKHNTPTHQPPIMTVSIENGDIFKKKAMKAVDENLIMLMEESRHQFDFDSVSTDSTTSSSDGSPVFFRKLKFSLEVPIRLDYHGKRLDMTHGSIPGLLMGLGQLNCSELRLKKITYRHGLLGVDKLMAFLIQEWLSDIRKNQLPSLLGGVGPMHTLVQLFQGVRDLFWLPIEQYQKDGRIVRGLQKGANSFTTCTAMAALELTSRLIHLIQITAETAYDMLSPGPSVRMVAKSKGKRKRYHQPQDIREGMTNAFMLMKEGIGETAGTIVQVAAHEKEQKGYSGAVGGVLRQIPPTILKPIIIASEATSNVLGGMRSQLVPDARREANQKWRSDDNTQCDNN
ncbi:autophagy-related protein 2 homolog A [Diorhabda sublineata]|uniref:autophagy-related protein 2 homolog A n=1 Tax=Diorhabda sublineata TaxID=1163346 RepID=UPI0024E1775D|nr:autophagy-related protein 2 homolog A [Diorhabda sublineata]